MLFRLEAIQKMIDLAIPTLLDDRAKEVLSSIRDTLHEADTLEQQAWKNKEHHNAATSENPSWDVSPMISESHKTNYRDISQSYSLSQLRHIYSFFIQKIVGKDLSEIDAQLTFSSIVHKPEDWDNIQKNLMALSLFDISLQDNVIKTFERFLCDQLLHDESMTQGALQ